VSPGQEENELDDNTPSAELRHLVASEFTEALRRVVRSEEFLDELEHQADRFHAENQGTHGQCARAAVVFLLGKR
jgi:hypothetical protein